MKKSIIFLILIFLIIGVQKVDAIGYQVKNSDTDEISSIYSFSPKFSSSPNVYWGNMLSCEWINGKNACRNKNDKYIGKGQNIGNVYAVYENVGFYEGIAVDLKIVLDHIEFRNTEYISIGFAENDIGIRTYSNSSDNQHNARIYFKIQYLKHGTNELIADDNKTFKSNITFTDLDYGEEIGIKKNDIDYAYVLDTNPMVKKITNVSNANIYHIDGKSSGNYFYYTGNHNISLACNNQVDENYLINGFVDANCGDVEGSMGDPIYGVIKYEDSIMKNSSRKNVLEQIRNGSLNYLANDSLNISGDLATKLTKYTNFFSQAGMLTVLFKKSEFTISWNHYYTGFTDSGFLKLGEISPIKQISTEYNKEFHTNDDGTADRVEIGEEINYQIIQQIPNQPEEFYYNIWYIYDMLPEELDVDVNNISVKANNSNISSDDFIVTFNSINNQLTVSAKESVLESENFYKNNYVTINIKAKVKDNVTSGTLFKNQAKLYIKRANENKKESDSNIVYAQVANTECEAKLNQIKNSNSNSGEVIVDLINLYNKFPDENLNQLLNYKFNANSTLNLDGVACSTVQCENSHSLSCKAGNVTSNKPLSNEIENRVCYLDTINSNGSFSYSDLGLYCNVSYNYELPLWSDTVYAGQFLSKTLPNQSLGSLNMIIDCFGKVDSSVNPIIEYEKLPEVIKPKIKFTWKSGNNSSDINLISTDYEVENSSDPKLCNDNDCVVNLSYTYKYPLFYENNWYSTGISGIMSRDYTRTIGYGGLLISIEDALKGEEKKEVNLSFKALKYDYNTVCDYIVENQILKSNREYNLGFRVIDTNNPFPGINGDSRLVGSNWCDMKEDIIYCKGDNTNNIVKNYIIDKPNSNGNHPIYSFTITPNEIRAIRDYNDDNSYNDFGINNMDDNGHYLSEFITNWLNGYIKIKNKNDVEIINKTTADNSSCFNNRLNGNWCSN